MRNNWDSWMYREMSETTKAFLRGLGWLLAYLFGAFTLTLPVWMYLLRLV